MVALGSLCGKHDSVGAAADLTEQFPLSQRRNMTAFSHLPTAGNHATPDQIQTVMNALWGPDPWQQYTRLTIVRNPWARAVSWWDYARNQLGAELDFEQCLENTERAYWFDGQGARLATVYLRCEQLDQDYQRFCDEHALPWHPLPRLRRGTRDHRKPYWDYFNDQSRQRVADNFALEIDQFGYQFGDPA